MIVSISDEDCSVHIDEDAPRAIESIQCSASPIATGHLNDPEVRIHDDEQVFPNTKMPELVFVGNHLLTRLFPYSET